MGPTAEGAENPAAAHAATVEAAAQLMALKPAQPVGAQGKDKIDNLKT